MSKIKQFQEILKNKKIDAYIIPSFDYHNSEYVSLYFKGRNYLSGFTGSAGTLLVTQDKALLWTDGRYHIQAAKELENTSIELMKQGIPGVDSIKDYLKKTLADKAILGFDGKVLSTSFVKELVKEIPNIQIVYDYDLLDEIWKDRPALPFSMLYRLEDFYCGKAFNEKITDVRKKMQALKADTHIITSLEDQAWLYNLRANDVIHTPVFLAFTIITENQCLLFIDSRKIDKTIEKYLKDNEITVYEYFEFYDHIKTINNKNILIDLSKVNYSVYASIADTNYLIEASNPTLLMKSIKNETEIKNTKNAHIKDGVAFTKFMYYVKNNINTDKTMTEISVSDYLAEQRKSQQSFVDLSFNTICAYKEHAALMHYSATPETNAILENKNLLLIDSGGHYLDGTTDITRTIALGEISDNQKTHYTTVLKSVIALSEAVFLKEVRGINLDILARGPIWKQLIDYKCGTGHGVGYLLSVHEGPNGFRWHTTSDRNDSAELQPGMITTNEPGIYLEGKYGIRLENEMLCVEKGSSEFGDFLGFETITYAPFDLDAINPNMLNQDEKNWLNEYHNMVFDKISPYMQAEMIDWLKKYTRKL